MSFATLPPDIKGCQHFIKLAEDHDARNILVAYYSRMAAIQLAMKIVPGSKPPEVSKFLAEVMDWLEKTKRENVGVEGISNEIVAQALIEEYIIKLYNYAYNNDCNSTFNKSMVKAYYTSSLLCEVLHQFGPLSEDLSLKCQTAKYRATYIHNMLKSGLDPLPVNVTIVHSDEEESRLSLTRDEVNERRRLRGQGPIEDEPPEPIDPERLEAHKKMIEDIKKNEMTKLIAELKERKEQISREIDAAPDEDVTFNQYGNDDDEDEYGRPITNQNEDGGPSEPNTYVNPNPAPTPGLSSSSSIATLEPDQTEKAVKYCKWASSALNYDDVKTAVENLEKALYLCRFGKEKE